jgi:hypothetical protein
MMPIRKIYPVRVFWLGILTFIYRRDSWGDFLFVAEGLILESSPCKSEIFKLVNHVESGTLHSPSPRIAQQEWLG